MAPKDTTESNSIPQEDMDGETSIGERRTDTDKRNPTQARTDGSDDGAPDEIIGLSEAQDRAREAANDFLQHELEGVIKAERKNDDTWRAVVEVVERSAVPNTQDIIGRYEITLDQSGEATGYELVERYRRGEMKEEL
ncbi:gas vesicle protein GvpO [Halorubrum vacuolatum]|uniref:Gas vesicle synthesis protein GvpO n=1 Tax=Halorubrum vacuolatum TaxID=63740 RepID=O33400_HALVU|nr:gas vesicle protein [Halorubrum vacuolatum]CAA69883.1 gvpO [Halorubrum vacuolatum]SNR69901.1 Gas vesicle synthesis protein GvpO [Halorubrum vacuolatum]